MNPNEDCIESWLNFFQECGHKCYIPEMTHLWSLYPSFVEDPFDALSIFLSNYAYERGGTNNPDYPALSVFLLEEAKNDEKPLNSNLAYEIWCNWNAEIQERRGDKKRSRPKKITLPLDSTFDFKEQGKYSIIKYASLVRKPISTHLWDTMLTKGVGAAHEEFSKVIGVGPKIASFFLRDVSQVIGSKSKLEGMANRELLQPQDIWVNRISNKIFFDIDLYTKASDKSSTIIDDERINVSRVIVEKSGPHIIPEIVNMGMWYFGSRIMKSRFRLMKLFEKGNPLESAVKYSELTNWGTWKIDQ